MTTVKQKKVIAIEGNTASEFASAYNAAMAKLIGAENTKEEWISKSPLCLLIFYEEKTTKFENTKERFEAAHKGHVCRDCPEWERAGEKVLWGHCSFDAAAVNQDTPCCNHFYELFKVKQEEETDELPAERKNHRKVWNSKQLCG